MRLAPPRLSTRFVAVWRRNFLVWRKLAIASMLGNFADPLIYMLGLGYGLGPLLPEVDGSSYIVFLSAGTVCYSTMNSATFESLYSAFSRMQVQRTWDAILYAPMDLDDIVVGEWVWAASKAALSGCAILIVIWLLGLTRSPLSLWLIAIACLIGLCFAGLGLIVTALAPSYDFFMFYFTLIITPMALVSGVFFPTAQLPEAIRQLAAFLPLTHAVDLARPLIMGRYPSELIVPCLVLAGYALGGLYVALILLRRRLQP